MPQPGQRHSQESTAHAPLIVGIGRTGLRIATQLSGSAGRALRLLAVFPGRPPTGPSPVPIVAWPMDRDLWAEAAIDLRSRAGSPPAAVVAFGLGAEDTASIAEGVAAAVSQCAGAVAAVGVAPFSFEGPTKNEVADAVIREVSTVVDIFAVARRDNVRYLLSADTPLQRACQVVDDIAARATETIARMLATSSEATERLGVCAVGAAAADGAAAVHEAVQTALLRSLLDHDKIAFSGNALLALVMGRVPTLGEVCEAEEMLREALSHDATVSLGMAIDPHLETRALASICVSEEPDAEAESVFPSEDPRVLDVPAFLRRRSTKARTRRGAGISRWQRSA